jgi:hypothetical protein
MILSKLVTIWPSPSTNNYQQLIDHVVAARLMYSGDAEDIIVANNVHKTYLLGIEGVPALRGISTIIFTHHHVGPHCE